MKFIILLIFIFLIPPKMVLSVDDYSEEMMEADMLEEDKMDKEMVDEDWYDTERMEESDIRREKESICDCETYSQAQEEQVNSVPFVIFPEIKIEIPSPQREETRPSLHPQFESGNYQYRSFVP